MSATSAPDRDPNWGDYDGNGIWYACSGCKTLHETKDTPEFHALLEQLCCDIGASSREIYDMLGIGTGEGRWDVNPQEGLFTFTDPHGRVSIAPYGVVASWNERSHSWMWAWGFPENWFPEPALAASVRTLAAGKENGWQAVTERLLAVNEHEAWHLTKLVAHVNGWPLTYRAKVNDINWHYYAIARPIRAT